MLRQAQHERNEAKGVRMSAPLTSKIILITGASRGIGAATALAAGAAGAHVILTARTSGGLEDVEAQIHASGGTATLAPLDLTTPEAIGTLAQVIGQRWGKLDGLILNAAQLGEITPVAHTDLALFDRVLAVNLTANFQLLRAFDPLLRASEAGRVIGLTSSVARQPRAYWGAYAASKAALENLLLTYGDEVAAISAVKVALYNPGRTATQMRTQAFPGEDSTTLPKAQGKAAEIVSLLINDFSTGLHYDSGVTGMIS
jgi:NAD(P)-dependent dehydrogenase (short-subunit alcohol dehydrogenase family)